MLTLRKKEQAELVDISTPRMVSLEEVASLFQSTPGAIRARLRRGTFPVRPKADRPARWSSTELAKYFADDRKRG